MRLDFEALRHNLRWVINILTLIVLVLNATEFKDMIPVDSMPLFVTLIAIINQILSIAKRFTIA